MKTINVALIGQGFMGRSHSNAWGQVNKFFQPPMKPVMHTVFGQEQENPQDFADNWGWQNASTDWQQTISSPEIGLIDVVTPNFMHAPPAKAALEGDTRTLAFEAGRRWGTRINTISAGPLASRAAKAIGTIEKMVEYYRVNAALPEENTAEDVGLAAAFLCSPLAAGITGETLHVDKGYHAMGMPAKTQLTAE